LATSLLPILLPFVLSFSFVLLWFLLQLISQIFLLIFSPQFGMLPSEEILLLPKKSFPCNFTFKIEVDAEGTLVIKLKKCMSKNIGCNILVVG